MVFKIAIIGAGPAGTLLARLLLSQPEHHISVTIYESEHNLNVRSQGGSLDLHTHTGQLALRRAGLYDEFLQHARFDGEALKIADKKLLCYITQGASTPNSSHGRPEIDRPQLREMLLRSLPPDTIHWRKKLIAVDDADDNRTLQFADGSTTTGFDLIVGADGAWSQVRRRLTDTTPFYSGIAGHAFSIPDAAHTCPALYALVNRGSLFAFSDGKSIMGQQMGDGSLNVSTWARRPADWQHTAAYDVHSAEAVKAAVPAEYADWDPRLVALTQNAQGPVTPRDLYMLPVGMRWDHVPGVTLVGDAAHLMTPFAGEGVNLAFQDALKLSEAIFSAAAAAAAAATTDPTSDEKKHAPSTHLDEAIAAFEQNMFTRARHTQQMTSDMMHGMFFTEGAPRRSIEGYVIRAVSGEVGPVWTALLLKPIVYAWFFVFKLIW